MQMCIEPVRTEGEGVRRSGTAGTSADSDGWPGSPAGGRGEHSAGLLSLMMVMMQKPRLSAHLPARAPGAVRAPHSNNSQPVRKPLPSLASPLQIESQLTFFAIESDKLIRDRQDLHVFQIFTYIVHF